MEPTLATLPKLDSRRNQSIPAPMRRPWNGNPNGRVPNTTTTTATATAAAATIEPFDHIFLLGLQSLSARYASALVARPRP